MEKKELVDLYDSFLAKTQDLWRSLWHFRKSKKTKSFRNRNEWS